MDEKTNINQGAGNNADMNFSDELQQIITDNMFWLKRRSKVRQSDLAKGLGISQPTLSQKYSRTIAWTINDLAKAAVFFKVPVSYLVTDNFIEPSSEYRLVHNGPVDISRQKTAAPAGVRYLRKPDGGEDRSHGANGLPRFFVMPETNRLAPGRRSAKTLKEVFRVRLISTVKHKAYRHTPMHKEARMAQSRRMLVLRAVVEDYIRSQEPVGSTTLTRDHDLGVSSATVRNDMAALEDEGYLIQPHTSAGRVPTEKGYRYFVDRLATVVPLSEAQRRGINSFLSGSVNLQDTLQRAARLLAQITGQVAVVAAPSLSKSTLRHIEIVPVSINTLLAVVITDTGRVAQHILNVTKLPDVTTLTHLTNEINTQCSGVSLTRTADCVRQMGARKEYHAISTLAETLAQAFDGMADDERASELYMAGTSRLAHQRTMADLAPLFDALEEQVVLMKLMSSLSETTQSDGVGVAIGSETHTPGLLHASVVTSGYGRTSAAATDGATHAAASSQTENQSGDDTQQAGEPVAFVGSIGPTHMDYAATMAAVRAVARYLTAFLAHDEGQPAD